MSLPSTITLALAISDDQEITCIFCGYRKIDLDVELFHPGKRSWGGAHQKCVDQHNQYFLRRYANQPDTLSNRILAIASNFDVEDPRCDNVRELSRAVASLQKLIQAANMAMYAAQYTLEKTHWTPTDNFNQWSATADGYNHAQVQQTVQDLMIAQQSIRAVIGPNDLEYQVQECDRCGAKREPWQDPQDIRCPRHAIPGSDPSCDGTLHAPSVFSDSMLDTPTCENCFAPYGEEHAPECPSVIHR